MEITKMIRRTEVMVGGLYVLLVSLVVLIMVNAFSDFTMASKGQGAHESSVGKLVNVREVPTSWNDKKRTRIETDMGIFYVRGNISTMKGIDVSIEHHDSGKRYVCLSDRDICFRLIDKR